MNIVAALANDIHIGEGGIDFVDMGAFADEAAAHHQEAIDGLLHAGRTERMTRERLGRGDGWRFVAAAENIAQGTDFLGIADRCRRRMRIDVIDWRF